MPHNSLNNLPGPLRNALELLGLGWPTTQELLASAFRKAALKAHPDRGGTNEQMLQVNKANEVIRAALKSGPQDGWGGACEHQDWDFGFRQYEARRRRGSPFQWGPRPRPGTVNPPEPHEYEPPSSVQDAFNRSANPNRQEFCNLAHWQKSRLKQYNLTRKYMRHQCNLFYDLNTGNYGWVVSELGERQGRVSMFSSRRFSTRKEAVENLAEKLSVPK
jgi:hypothetical protein